MTDPDEYGDILRRALHAEADTIVPAANGLERILARLDEQPSPRSLWAWLTTGWARPVMVGAAALFLAAIAVSAPPAIESITSTGGGGEDPTGQGRPGQANTSGAVPPNQNGQPGQVTPDPRTSEQLSSALSLPPSPSPGEPTCPPKDATAESPTPAASTTPAPAPPEGEPPVCESPATTTSPSPDVATSQPDEPPPSSVPPQEPQSSGGEQQSQVAP